MKNLLRLSVCLTALNLYSLQASNLEEERVTQAQSASGLSQLLEHHLDKPLSLSDIITIRRTLAEHIINITGARTVAQEDYARLYMDSLADPTQAYYISQETVRRILDLDDNGQFRIHAPVEGGGSVPTHRTAHFGGIYFKQDGSASLTPGMEYAMYSFYGMLVGQVLAPSCLMVLRDVHSAYDNTFFVQASQLIPGLTLEKALQQGQVPVLNPDNVSRFLTGSWLTSPSDYKADNMVVLPKGEQNYLLGIDDDLALNDPVVRENKDSFQHVLGIKQILYCIPEYMSGMIFSEQLRRELLAINPSLKVLEWSQALAAQNERYSNLKQAGVLYEGDQTVLGLPIKLIPGIASHIEQQLIHLQAILHDHGSLTHAQIWQKLQPIPYFIYKSITEQNKTPLECLNLIYARGEQPLESYLPLNTYLEGYELSSEGRQIYTRRRLYRHLRQYQALASDHVTQLTEEIQTSLAMLVDRLPVTKLPPEDRLRVYQFISDRCPEALLNSHNPAWRQQEILQGLYRQTSLTESQIALLLQLGLELESATDTQETELHRLVKAGSPYHHHIRALIQQGCVDIDAVNSSGFTALDEALVLNEAATVKLLLELGAGKQVKLAKLMNFYQEHADEAEWQTLLRALRKRNREFAWQSSVWHLMPPLSNQQDIDQGRLMCFASLKPSRRLIAPGLKIERVTQEGRRAVIKLMCERQGERQSVYLKFYPELPGFEAAISLLMNRYLFGFGAPYGELGMIAGSTPCYISQGIEGESLLATLRHHPERLKELDAYFLSALFIGSMLIAPEDGKPDNYIVEPLDTGKCRLIAIDNDHALADPLAGEVVQNRVKCCPQVKTILYCMDQMQDLIHPDVKAKIVATDFRALLERWLMMLNGVQQEYTALFNNHQHLQNLYLNAQYPCFIGIPFKTEMVAKLYDRCVRMQTFFLSRQGDKLPTHYAILKAVEPVLAERYNIKPIQHLSLLERFEKIDGKYFQKSEHGHFMTTTNLDILLAGLHLDVQKLPQKKSVIEAVRLSNNIGPAQALRELQAEHQALANQDRSLQQFKVLKTEEARGTFLEQLPPVAVSLQESWLKEIQNQRCRHLTLTSFNQLQDNHILKWQDLKNLTYLNVRGCEKLSNSLVGKLAGSCLHLTYLDASQTALPEFSNAGLVVSGLALFKKLKVLKLEACSKLIRMKLVAPKLLQLSLANSVNFRDMEGRLPRLIHLNLSNLSQLPQSVFGQMFGQLTQFKVINLTNCPQLPYADLITEAPGYSLQVYKYVSQLSDDQRIQWQRLLRNDSTLQQLNLVYNQIGEEGAEALAEALKINSTLQWLVLNSNQIGDAGTGTLAEALKVNRTLQQLNLNLNRIGDAGAKALAAALQVNSTLQQLELHGNEIGEEGAKALAEALKVNRTLQRLDLWENKIGDAGAKVLAEALKKDSTLQQLDLWENKIGKAGAEALAEALNVNRTLQQLGLGNNRIGDEGAQVLAEVLKVNRTLQHLYLGSNKIGDAGANALAEALKVNSTLQKLELSSNQISNALQKQIEELFKGRVRPLSAAPTFVPSVSLQVVAPALEESTEDLVFSQFFETPAVHQTITESPTFNRTNPEPWSYSILSIDGGGIRGYIPALVLERMKEEWLGYTDIHSLFDYIGGTSVGGILSLGLAVPQIEDDSRPRYSISDLTQLFSRESHRIFPQNMKVARKINPLFSVKYNEKPLEGLLQQYFGDALLSSSLTPTLVTTWVNHRSSCRSEGFTFTSVAAQRDELDDYHMWEVARCTSAAPTHFKGYQIKNIHNRTNPFPADAEQPLNPYRLYSHNDNQTWLYDGGLWYNNPTRLTYKALQEYTAQSAVPVTDSNCIVVSLGTGQSPTVSLKPAGGIINSIEPLIEGSFYQKDLEVENYCRRFGSNYYRFQPILQREIALDDTDSANLDTLRDAAATLFLGETLETLARRLQENKANRHPAQLF
jgi:patatin-like phospholipase/acyl hydrolase/Ran GTPase-activating protein (RanGAP) involved in mRNA processing and transport